MLYARVTRLIDKDPFEFIKFSHLLVPKPIVTSSYIIHFKG